VGVVRVPGRREGREYIKVHHDYGNILKAIGEISFHFFKKK